MTTDAKIQVNLKSGEGFDAALINVYANDENELAHLLGVVERAASTIATTRAAVAMGPLLAPPAQQPANQAVQQVQNPTQGFQQQQTNPYDQPQGPPPAWVPPQQQGYAPPPQQQQATQFSQPQQGPAPTCQHGTKTFLVDRKNNPPQWQAWACPADKNNPSKCKLQYV